MTALPLFLLAVAVLSIGFTAVYFAARRLDNYGIVDVAWAFGLCPIAILYATLGQGDETRRILVAALASLWSLRLGTYLAVRVLGKRHTEDGRYQQLRKDWSHRFGLKMFCFFQAQAVLLSVLSLPFLFSSFNQSANLHPVEIMATGLVLLAVAGEAVADLQLARFKGNPLNRRRVCDAGLWRWSRHPNYFFESLSWFGFAFFASVSPWGWVALICPLLMLYFLLRVTGVRYTEDQLLRSKGEAYLQYRERTSAFVPIPPSFLKTLRTHFT
jgi:steroid 5-alpha reductase family enzyme